MVAPHVLIAKGRNTFSFQTDSGSGLGSRCYCIDNISIHGLDTDISTEGSDCLGNICIGADIDILTFEGRIVRYNNLYKKITSWSTILSRFSVITDSYTLSVIDTGRNR